MSEPTTPSLRDSLEAAIGTEKVEAAPAPETVDYADAPAAEAEPQTASDEAPAAPAQDLNAWSQGRQGACIVEARAARPLGQTA